MCAVGEGEGGDGGGEGEEGEREGLRLGISGVVRAGVRDLAFLRDILVAFKIKGVGVMKCCGLCVIGNFEVVLGRKI